MSAPAPRVPQGEPLAWTDDDLDTLSQISPEDIATAAAWWRQYSVPQYRRLLDAEPTEEDQ